MMKHKCEGFFLVLVAFVSLSTASRAQQHPIVGAWQGSTSFMGNPGSVQTVLLPNGTYKTLILTSFQGRPIHYGESGVYQMIDNNTIHFSVRDYDPKTKPDGTPLIPQTESIFKFWFLNATTVVFQSPGGVPIRLTRVP